MIDSARLVLRINIPVSAAVLSAAAATENNNNENYPNAIKILISTITETHLYTPLFLDVPHHMPEG